MDHVDVVKLKKAIKLISLGVVDSVDTSQVVYAELIKDKPPKFRINIKLEISHEMENLQLPYLVFFKPDDIGKQYAFIQNKGGQGYRLLHRVEKK